MSTRFNAIAAVFTFVIALLGATALSAQDANPFTGRVVLIQLRTLPNQTVVLTDLSTRELGETKFLVGKRVTLNPPNEASKALTQWVNIGEIATITEYKDLDTYRKVRARAEEPER